VKVKFRKSVAEVFPRTTEMEKDRRSFREDDKDKGASLRVLPRPGRKEPTGWDRRCPGNQTKK